MTYNFTRRFKALKGLTSYEYICKIWSESTDRFIINPPSHQGTKHSPRPTNSLFQQVFPKKSKKFHSIGPLNAGFFIGLSRGIILVLSVLLKPTASNVGVSRVLHRSTVFLLPFFGRCYNCCPLLFVRLKYAPCLMLPTPSLRPMTSFGTVLGRDTVSARLVSGYATRDSGHYLPLSNRLTHRRVVSPAIPVDHQFSISTASQFPDSTNR
jgi:hypothetical protein